jgi:hypothetical protein
LFWITAYGYLFGIFKRVYTQETDNEKVHWTISRLTSI